MNSVDVLRVVWAASGGKDDWPMKAAVYAKIMSAKVLQMIDVDTPIPKDNEVLLKTRAVSGKSTELADEEPSARRGCRRRSCRYWQSCCPVQTRRCGLRHLSGRVRGMLAPL